MPVALPSRLNHTPPPEDMPRALTPGPEEPDESTVHPRGSPQELGESLVLKSFMCLSRVSSDTLAPCGRDTGSIKGGMHSVPCLGHPSVVSTCWFEWTHCKDGSGGKPKNTTRTE